MSTSEAGSLAPDLRVGEVHIYTIDWQTHGARGIDGTMVSGGLTLRGELAVSALSHGPDGTRVSLWFPSLRESALVVHGERVELDPRELVDLHAEFVVDASGDVRHAYFAADSPPMFRELMRGVIARYDLRGANPGPERRTLRGGHGLVEVVYRREPSGVVVRDLAQVVRFDTAPGVEVDPTMVIAEARIELDARRLPIAIDQRDSIDLGGVVELVSDDRFTLEYVRTREADPGVAPLAGSATELVELVELVMVDPTAGPDREAADRALDRQLAAGMTFDDIEVAIATMDGGVFPRPGLVSRAAALLRSSPELIPSVIQTCLRAGGNGRQLSFDLLASTGSSIAQAAMHGLLLDPAARGWSERALLFQRFAFVSEPSSATGGFLLDQLAAAQSEGDEKMVRAILHPLGTVAGRVQDPVLAEQMHQALVRAAASEVGAIRAASISGLGNARRASDRARLIGALADPDPDVRVEAAAALRAHVVPEATAALLEALDDSDVAVASRALTVLHERHYEGQPGPELIARATLGRYQPALDRAMASALVGTREQVAVRDAIAAIAARTGDPALATELTLLLGAQP
ncbi:HEAT repeat domain-containing protein [Enhygromyxa salina]|uniref:HEAT repeat domain-containing protein n=1 Tax=Enhygromyxa salina TaxID=215803 RepID=A0A2S9Y0U9_9BACT|nr:HEAT repeat domain-containing protein [Enhygromyxa salina]PRP98631.1 hypothetical protein ENSA7_65740 [Enhygromyxa salina]